MEGSNLREQRFKRPLEILRQCRRLEIEVLERSDDPVAGLRVERTAFEESDGALCEKPQPQ